MNYLNKFNSFRIFEAEESGKEKRDRSERLLSQAQVEYEDKRTDSSGPQPAMLFTDVVGSSKMWSDDPVQMMAQLEEHHKLVNSISEKYNGWIVKTIGDAFMVYFESSNNSLENAIKCASEIIKSENRYNLRIGICQGPMDEKTYNIQKVDLKDFYGNVVNVASRMESKVAGEGGTVAFSSLNPISNELISKIEKMIGDVEEVDLGKYDLRGASIKKAFKVKVK
jgi:class 3 adenylate cyclase